ncbi:hypothetical protein MLD38_009751 [Melastoma candidum]|uniref:Uncharacterized protein n=1 Tax=Melastoma candidum TaxID=119954 RepID=A0ACB9S293_9MYRT|nr:hypothetical protein MLD38_009751 [Melastoma candidum]
MSLNLNRLSSLVRNPCRTLRFPISHLPTSKSVHTFPGLVKTQRCSVDIDSPVEGPAILANTTALLSKLLWRCCAAKSFGLGKSVHARVILLGLSKDPKLRIHLVTLYAKSRDFACARELVDQSPEPDTVSWSALISGYAQNGHGEEAILAFREMRRLGLEGNEFTLPSVLKSCSLVEDLVIGRQVHGEVVVTGYEGEEFVANTLVVLYAKCGSLGIRGEASFMFEEMVSFGVKPSGFTLSSLLGACAGLEDCTLGMKVHGYLVKLGYDVDIFAKNALVDMYAKAGNLDCANLAFKEIPVPDIVSWNAIIAGCVLHEGHCEALTLFERMKRLGAVPNLFTLSSAAKACSGLELKDLARQLHSHIIKLNGESDKFLSVGIVDMYSKCNSLADAETAYESMQEKDIIVFNALLSGYSQNGEDSKVMTFFADTFKEGLGFNQTTLSALLKSAAAVKENVFCSQVHTISLKSGFISDAQVRTTLVDVYGKCGRVDDAQKAFEMAPREDVLATTALMSAYAQYGQGEESVKLYIKGLNQGVQPDPFFCSSLLNACANLSAYEQGKQAHTHILKFGFLSDIFAGNSLVNMYAKCGAIDDANHVFCKLSERGTVSWSAMISGLAQHGCAEEALEFFNKMLEAGVSPNHVTLLSVLSACNHAGLVDKAKEYFDSMVEKFGVKPMQEHYACMIDLLGRAGMLEEAMEMIQTMPFEANGHIWGAMLGAARIHKNVELGEQAAKMLFVIEPENSGTIVLLANVYASVGMWDKVAEARKFMKHSKVKKEPGMSWVEIKDKVHTFIVGDRSHDRTDEIYAKLDELGDRMKRAGYVPVVETDLHNVETTEKEKLLYHHTESQTLGGLKNLGYGVPVFAVRSPFQKYFSKHGAKCNWTATATHFCSTLFIKENLHFPSSIPLLLLHLHFIPTAKSSFTPPTIKSATMSAPAPPALLPIFFDEKWKLLKKGLLPSSRGRSSSSLAKGSKSRKCSFTRRCTRLVQEQRARFYIMRRCVTMLVCWHDYGDS